MCLSNTLDVALFMLRKFDFVVAVVTFTGINCNCDLLKQNSDSHQIFTGDIAQ